MQRGDLLSTGYVTRAAAWAQAVLEALAAGAAVPEGIAAIETVAELAARFRLETVERRVMELALGVARAPAAARLARELSGRARLTVALLRAALGDEAEAALGARRPLRAHGLVTVTGVPGGIAEAGATVALAPGLGARLAGMTPGPDELGPGIDMVQARVRPNLPEALAAALRDHLVDVEPGWVTIRGARAGDAALLAEALSQRLQRPVVLVDGRAVGALRDAWDVVAAVRRECDLTDTALIVDATAGLGPAWRAAAAPAPVARRVKPVVLVNPELPVPPKPEGFLSHALSFFTPAAGPAEPPAPEPPPDALEAARRRAAVDAQRALGKPVPGVDKPIEAAIARPAAPPDPEAVAAAPEPEPAAAPAPPPATPPPAEAAPPPPAVAVAVAPEAPAPEAPPPAAAAAPEAAAAPAPPAEPPPPDPAESLPYLPIPDDAQLGEIIQIAHQTPNPKQRVEIIRQLSAGPKNVVVLKLLRAFVASPHAGVRAACEEGMKKMFGAGFGKTRDIPPPAQPPRSDD